jgi:7-cyano-7-deazaguanine synthase
MKSVVLLSSGLDSTVNLYAAQKHGQVLTALTFDYGQKASTKEISSARKICETLKIKHRVIDLPFFKNFKKSSLVMDELPIPSGQEIKIDDLNTSQQSAKSVWVPNRNGIFLNIAAGFAESLQADSIIPGFNKEEALTFPDNSQGFLSAMTESLSFSTSNQVKVQCFTTAMSKTEVVQFGIDLKVDFSMIWPCYLGGEHWCGQCESCQRSRRAMTAAGIETSRYFQ